MRSMSPKIETTARALRVRLDLLYAELAATRETDLSQDCSYMTDLRAELNEVYAAWAMATVMERVLARARVDGPLHG